MSPRSCVALAVRLADARSHVVRGSTGSRGELCVWMCEAHNRVNRLLGKAEFSCELSQLDMRWCGARDPPTPAAGRLTQFASLSDRRDGGERCGGEAFERDVSDTRE